MANHSFYVIDDPDADQYYMKPKQIEKELQKQTVLFKEASKCGQIVSAVKFEPFAEDLFEDCAKLNLKSATEAGVVEYITRIYESIDRISDVVQRNSAAAESEPAPHIHFSCNSVKTRTAQIKSVRFRFPIISVNFAKRSSHAVSFLRLLTYMGNYYNNKV